MIKVSREALAEKELEIAELRRQLEARTAVTTNAAVAANTDSATTETSTSAVNQPGVYRSTFHTLPASSAWCYGEALKNRYVINLCSCSADIIFLTSPTYLQHVQVQEPLL